MKKLLLVAVLALAGCGGGSKKSGTTPPPGGGGGATIVAEDRKPGAPAHGPDCAKVAPISDAEAETEGLGLVDAMGELFSAHQNDCKALAAAIMKWSTDNQDLMNRMNCYTQSLPEDRKAAFEEKAQARFEAHSENMMTAVENCGADEDFQKAMEEAVK